MSVTSEVKTNLIDKYKQHEGDTGSPQVQIAILTERIKNLTGHFRTHKKDHTSRRGMLKLIGLRMGLLKYLKRKNKAEYYVLIQALAIRDVA